ncbi:vacuolar protein sorting-associated protein [Citrus sinensis]|nr:vacuolar protein sorting-associated protein [Citrus sinensis]
MSRKTTERHQSIKQESSNGFKAMVPNGAIVAIQDVDQHSYFTVEDGENKYTLSGAIHYSLVGERALFRVKYHKQKRWMSSVLWFSLISLYAKNDLGEPLRLNYRSGSCFVDISSSDDSSCALWRMLPCDSESYRGDVDWEAQNQLVKDTFYLVNKKNDCAVAFIDGVPEFVKKPGNSFKFKEFNNLSVTRDLVVSDGYSLDASGTNVCRTEHDDEDKTSEKSGGLPCIHIKIDKVALTVVHELLDTKDRLPLLCACMSDTQIAVQSLSTKARVMSTSRALLSYFDAQRNLWRELVQPIEICIYYRSSFQIQGSKALWHRVPLRIYCRIKEFQIFLTELSLDILLFVIGKLDLAGPYLIRSSHILANCCKVENQSGLNLHCHFYEQQSVTVGRKQSASIFLRLIDLDYFMFARKLTLVNQAPDSSSVVSIQLSLGSFMTSSIYLSLLESRSLTWRTRIVSAQDSRTFPGPFIVVDISRKSEDGLSIVVSPLIRVHNETELSMELRFRRVQEQEDDFASILLKPGHTIDDSMAMFDAVSFSGGLKKALMSLSVGNFLFSFRPGSSDGLISSKSSLSAEWSEELTGGKAVRLSGIFDKLSYEVRRALSVQSEKCSFSTAHCVLKAGDIHVASMHFLIQSIGRDVPIIEPDKSSDGFESRSLPIALQEQKEIFLLPTVLVTNLLHLDIHVLLSETDLRTNSGSENIGKQATLPCGSKADFYANPAIMYFIITLPDFRSSCKPLNSSDWVNKLLKHKNDVRYLDIDLDFGAGKYFASLRLSRGQRGILEATIFTSNTLRNETDVSLLFFAPNQKPLSWDEVQKSGFSISPEIGLLLPPKSTGSWFLKSHKIRFRLLDDHSSEALLDLDALSGLTEIKLEIDEGSGVKYFSKFGVSMGPSSSKVAVPSQTTTIVPRHVVLNETEERIIVRQCYLEDDRAGMFPINSKERKTLQLHDGVDKKRAFSSFENFIRKHRNDNDKSLIYIQFQLDESEFGWSGPLCISSLGRFFLKFRKKSDQVKEPGKSIIEFAAVHVAEEGSSLVVHFHKPPNVNLPYRIENCLRGASVTYYQKDSSEAEVLGSECSVDYVWDDLTLPHKLVVLITDMHTLREINLDKVRPWKPFFKLKQHRSLASYVAFGKKSGDQRTSFSEFNGMEIVKVGYEVRAHGPTRILRICESSDSHKRNTASKFCAKIQLRISYFALHLLEHRKQDMDESDASSYAPIVVGRLGNINLDSVSRDQQKYNQISVQSLNVEHKRIGAPFAAMLRRHQLGYKTYILKCCHTQPVDLNLDEETLMSIASFWRTSLSDSSTQSRQFYFDHFEILPIKIIANFLPGDSYSSYNSAQETVRSLLHSVVKVPSIKNMVVELNGVLVTHALITIRELLNKCGQHYLWYAMRSIYIAKGSPLLPPAFASIFDDSASSSLDVFFDPSYGLTNLPGLTLGTFKFISKCIDGKGFSGTKRYFGDLGKTLKTAGSNVLFAAVTEISDSVLRGAETSGFDGLVSGFHQGILKLAMEPSVLGSALIGGGPDRNINLDRSPGIDELYIEGYLQAMLDTMYRQEYLRVRVIDNQVFLKNLPPNNALINEIMDRVKGFLESEGLLKGDPSRTSRPSRQLRGENEWKIGPTVLTLCEHLFVSFAIRMLRRRADKLTAGIKWKKKSEADNDKAVVPVRRGEGRDSGKFIWKWGIGKFVLSGIIAYIDGRLCRGIPNPIARRIVGGFLLSFLDKSDNQ